MPLFRRWAAVVLAVVGLAAEQCLAGGGPENVLLVVNASSDASKTIANHYIRLRDIPPTNVLYLDWQKSTTAISGEVYRQELLTPITEAIESRKLAAQVDYVVYSADFPYRVDFSEDFAESPPPRQFKPWASLTGATYLWAFAKAKNPALVMPTINWYVPPGARKNQASCENCTNVPTRAFRARQFWTEQGTATSDPSKGRNYFLSTMLGVTVERGNSVDEVVRYLTRAVAADASEPDGVFYFMKNGDVRSKARHYCFPMVAKELQELGARVAILDGRVPTSAKAALGIMAGTASFKLDPNQVTIAPGAICEHFTSLGGRFDVAYQTKLSAWLRAGAAGSSGTVAEPYALQAKFPLPVLHLHYRRGASLAEAYYQSVSGPYQLLVVGDPLCQPWAKPPTVEIEGVRSGDTVQGVVTVKAKVTPQSGTSSKLAELYVDGRLVARYPHVLPVPLDTAKLAPGEHELRVVAITDDDLAFRGGAAVRITVQRPSEGDHSAAPEGRELTMSISPQPMVAAGNALTVSVSGPDTATGIDILQNQRRVAHVEGSKGSVAIDTRVLGRGPVALVAQLAAVEPDQPLAPPNDATRSRVCWVLVR